MSEKENSKRLACSFALFRKNGQIISNHGIQIRGSQSFFSILESFERDFLIENTKVINTKRFFLISTMQGPMLVFVGLVPQMGVLFAIKPKLSEKQLLFYAENRIFESVAVSPAFSNAERYKREHIPLENVIEFSKMLSSAFPSYALYMKYSMGMPELVDALCELSRAVFALAGGSVSVETKGNITPFLSTRFISVKLIHMILLCLATQDASRSQAELCFRVSNDYLIFEIGFSRQGEMDIDDFPLKRDLEIKSITYTFGILDGAFKCMLAPYYSVSDTMLKLPRSIFKFPQEVKKCQKQQTHP